MAEAWLSPELVRDFLVSRGLVPAGVEVSAKELGGGIANIVLAVDAGDLRLVVKQALPRFRVADDWAVKRERSATEAEALRMAGLWYPGSAPPVIASYPDAFVVVIERAPDGWRNYKEVLLSSEPVKWVAERCGEILGSWHRQTWGDSAVKARFNDMEAFEQQRIDPYYRTLALRRPELASELNRYVDLMLGNRKCFVHGDFSPKNVLFDDSELWVVDFEVAHFGDPVFDLAFMLNHLLLKSIHRPQIAEACLRSAELFLAAYESRTELPPLEYVVGQTACLMLARVDGKSPAEYLTEEGRSRARATGERLLKNPPARLGDAWA